MSGRRMVCFSRVEGRVLITPGQGLPVRVYIHQLLCIVHAHLRTSCIMITGSDVQSTLLLQYSLMDANETGDITSS